MHNRKADNFLNGDLYNVQRDLNVLVYNSLKAKLQVQYMIWQANLTLAFIMI